MKEIFWFAVAIAIVAGGWFGFQYLGANRTVIEAAPVERNVPLVTTTKLLPVQDSIPIEASGFITASRLLDIATEAGGRIVELHPAIDARGTFAEGEVLFRLDDRSARASVAQIEANIESTTAQLDLVTMQLDRASTLRERGIVPQDQLDQLVSREQELQATVRNLRAGLEAAEVALAHTIVRAPFHGRVLVKGAELGAVIAQGTSVAQIYSDTELEVAVNIRESEAALIADLFTEPKASAFVETSFAGTSYRWDASLVRVERQIDPSTRTLSVTVGLDDPNAGMPVDGDQDTAIPALINAFVTVGIEAEAPASVFSLDVNAVRNNSELWVVEDGYLRKYPVTVLHRADGLAYLSADEMSPDADIVISALSAPADGMEVSVLPQADAASLSVDGSGG